MKAKAAKKTPGVVHGGPFAGQTLWLSSFNTLPITCRGWIGYYEGVIWNGNEPAESEALPLPENVKASKD